MANFSIMDRCIKRRFRQFKANFWQLLFKRVKKCLFNGLNIDEGFSLLKVKSAAAIKGENSFSEDDDLAAFPNECSNECVGVGNRLCQRIVLK